MSTACSGVVFLGAMLPVPVFAGLCGLIGIALPLLFNFVFLSRKDRNDADQVRFQNSRDLLATQTDRRNDFTAALAKTVGKRRPSIDDIHAIMKSGEAYFETLRAMSHAVLDGRVTGTVRDHDFVPKICEALVKNVPLYYDTLRTVSDRIGLPYEGAFRESNYESLFSVADVYDREAWTAARQKLETPR